MPYRTHCWAAACPRVLPLCVQVCGLYVVRFRCGMLGMLVARMVVVGTGSSYQGRVQPLRVAVGSILACLKQP